MALFGSARLMFLKNFPTCTIILPYTSIRNTSVSESHFGNEYELNLQIDVNLLTSNYVDMN